MTKSCREQPRVRHAERRGFRTAIGDMARDDRPTWREQKHGAANYTAPDKGGGERDDALPRALDPADPPGQVQLTKPANWGSMSQRAKKHWKTKQAKHKRNSWS